MRSNPKKLRTFVTAGALTLAGCAHTDASKQEASVPAPAPAPTAEAAPAAHALSLGVATKFMDKAVRPQDDFFRYVNGTWLKTTTIPADKARYGSFIELRDKSEAALKEIIEEAAAKKAEPGTEPQKVGDLYRAFMDTDTIEKLGATPVQPLALIHAIGELLPKDAVVIDETVSSSGGLRQLVKSDDPQSYFGLRGGGIGWGLPAAIGVKLAVPERPVVALVGDGSAMYTVQALWTAAHYKIPVIWVIFNNTSYRILKQRLVAMRGIAEQADTFVGMELTNPAIDFVGLAKSLGIDAARAFRLNVQCG